MMARSSKARPPRPALCLWCDDPLPEGRHSFCRRSCGRLWRAGHRNGIDGQGARYRLARVWQSWQWGGGRIVKRHWWAIQEIATAAIIPGRYLYPQTAIAALRKAEARASTAKALAHEIAREAERSERGLPDEVELV